MRPQALNPLFAPATALPGVGPQIAKLLGRVAGDRVVDLLWHLPVGLIDRRFAPTVEDAPEGAIATMNVRVDSHRAPPRNRPRLPYKVRCSDETGTLDLVFFNPRADYIEKSLPVGAMRAVSGRVERFEGRLQMTHPDYIVPVEDIEKLPRLEPVYPLTQGLSLRVLGRIVAAARERAPALGEWLDPAWRAKESWPSWREAIRAVHAPADHAELAPTTPARRRLAFDELLASQLALALVRARSRGRPGEPVAGDGQLRARAIAALPYALTGAQRRASTEIATDMAKSERMLRLLQGDVGSGKTVVAFLAMLNAAETDRQAALMAPTEILARQHAATITPLADRLGLAIAVLTGRERGRVREEAIEGLASGRVRLAIGTHALLEEDVAFKRLALAVVDEQHRFGVHQRLVLSNKGQGTHVLVMTATPIPRTLQLAAYGDMDVSRLDEKPAGRKPVDTRAVALERMDEVVDAVGRAMGTGARVYWVCPLVEESELIDLAAATERHKALAARFGARAGLVHGRLKSAEKDAAMADFAHGRTTLLVATTVIEVGVDVPQATVMVIEHAERFGLAQLHQLRGRIGRGEAPSTCILLYGPAAGMAAKARLKIMRETDDGFRIAEEDLRLRGAGEMLGTRQSGLPAFRVADLAAHADLLEPARDDARLVLARDPHL
ncbi:MAG: ATP-dependent DNA helicase RecG, partial [Alphaproteobacteria bacterium]|nr:ATP-dependent DNA helicase RecG [Alphaproteobacteria bacterium]